MDAAPGKTRARRSRLRPFSADFYDRDTASVARDLLGATLECTVDGIVASGRIVEVEAYLGPHDPACHSAVGLTARNRHLHGPPGTVYVYRIYGMHWCVNAVTREAGHGSAVLIRALEPLQGIDAMRARRGTDDDRQLTNGPGKLCQALGITGVHDGGRLNRGAVRILQPTDGVEVEELAIVVTPRIGISQAVDWPLRFAIEDHPHVSRIARGVRRSPVHAAFAWLQRKALR